MGELKIEFSKQVGILFTVPKGTHRRSFLNGIFSGLYAVSIEFHQSKAPFFTVHNHKTEFCVAENPKRPAPTTWTDSASMPIVDLPCACGNPKCWLIQWIEIDPPIA